MDPKACLKLAAEALLRGDWPEATEHLNNYWLWRKDLGYEPAFDGDDVAGWLGDLLVFRPKEDEG